MSDAVLIAIVTTIPTLVTVVGGFVLQWRKLRAQDDKLDAINSIVNGNTSKLLQINHELVAKVGPAPLNTP